VCGGRGGCSPGVVNDSNKTTHASVERNEIWKVRRIFTRVIVLQKLVKEAVSLVVGSVYFSHWWVCI